MSKADSIGEFLELHRRYKTGELTAAEAERWQAITESLNRAPETTGATEPASLEWDPDLEPNAT
jgi:hypothetical protein